MRLAALLPVLLLAGCKPKFEPAGGSVKVDSRPFTPTACRVDTAHGGIELSSADGSRLAAVIPPQTLEAGGDVAGVAAVHFSAAGATGAQDLGSCGTLALTGEGYHADGKRAGRGKLVLACGRAEGELTFSGCF